LKPGLVVDTNAALWYLADDPELSVCAAAALDATTIAGGPIYVPAICVVEAIYLAEKGRIPGTALERLLSALEEPNPRFVLAPLDRIVAIACSRRRAGRCSRSSGSRHCRYCRRSPAAARHQGRTNSGDEPGHPLVKVVSLESAGVSNAARSSVF